MTLQGSLKLEGDKSVCHRLALVSLLTSGTYSVENFSSCKDVESSLKAIKTLGVEYQQKGHSIVFKGGCSTQDRQKPPQNSEQYLNCENSGTTARLLMGILSGTPGSFVIDGDLSLRKRPMERLANILRGMGADVSCTFSSDSCPDGGCPVRIKGKTLHGISHTLSNGSAQIKSSLILAGLSAKTPSLFIDEKPSRDHTERLISYLNGDVSLKQDPLKKSHLIIVNSLFSGQYKHLSAPDSFTQNPFKVPGDISAAAFFICFSLITPGSHLTCHDILLNPTRSQFLDILKESNADISISKNDHPLESSGTITSSFSPRLTSFEVSAEQIPFVIDEIPILTLVATQVPGTTIFHSIDELRLKESDRVLSLVTELSKLGADIHVNQSNLIVKGPTKLSLPTQTSSAGLQSYGDHRIAMTLRLASLLAGGSISHPNISDEDCINISFPHFHKHLKDLYV